MAVGSYAIGGVASGAALRRRIIVVTVFQFDAIRILESPGKLRFMDHSIMRRRTIDCCDRMRRRVLDGYEKTRRRVLDAYEKTREL